MHLIVTTALKARCRYAKGEYTTINKRPYVSLWIKWSHAQFTYKNCENWQKNFAGLLVIRQSLLPTKFLTIIMVHFIQSIVSEITAFVLITDANYIQLLLYLMLPISLNMNGQQVLPCCEPITTVNWWWVFW